MDVMALRRGLLAQMATVSDDKHLECGTFTIATDTKVYTINHGLGAVPDFCIVYPINVPAATATYRMCLQVLVGHIGQQDWNISSKTTEQGAWHGFWWGVNYALNADSAAVKHNFGDDKIGGVDRPYAGTATTTTIVVGGLDGTGTGGTLTAGTYGYILGRLNN